MLVHFPHVEYLTMLNTLEQILKKYMGIHLKKHSGPLSENVR